jgi:glycosyltransferase involved in cell wall biosynthesis
MAGAQKYERISCVPLPVHNVGQLKKDADMAALYSACDLTVVPSAQENHSNTIMESMSCGTPVVAFAIGGNSDLIDHRSNGYLAHPEDPRDLAWGMEWILENGYRWQELSRNARFKVDRTFRQDLVAKQYIHLYQGICTDSARM